MSISLSTLGVLWPNPGRVYVHEYFSHIEVEAMYLVSVCAEVVELPDMECGLSSDEACVSVETVDSMVSSIEEDCE